MCEHDYLNSQSDAQGSFVSSPWKSKDLDSIATHPFWLMRKWTVKSM